MINNIWWVIVVTALATAFGLAVAVLADRARGENIAKSMIFLPMAISFVGAGIIWRFMYLTTQRPRPQTGVLNAIWVGLGELSNSGWQKWLVAAVLAAIIVGLAWLAWHGVRQGNSTRAGFSIGFGLILVYLLYRLLGPGLGGFRTTEDGEVVPETIEFLTRDPVQQHVADGDPDLDPDRIRHGDLLVGDQGGTDRVHRGSANRRSDESQVFWRVTLPQILPTIGVVVTDTRSCS